MTDSTSRGPDELRERLKSALDRRGSIPTLTGSDYMRSHVAFESASGQQSKILAWLLDDLLGAEVNDLSIASIGAGSGILDVPMLSELSRSKQVDYVMVEPFAEQCAAFEDRVAGALSLGNPRVEIVQAKLEEFRTNRRFSHVLAIHSVYYFLDLAAGLQQLLELTAPGGQVTIAVAPQEAMNRLAGLLWQPQRSAQIWFEEDVLNEQDALGVEVTRERIDADLVFDPKGPAATGIASFLVQCPLESLGVAERDLVFAFLHEAGELRGEQLAVPHPVSMLKIRK